MSTFQLDPNPMRWKLMPLEEGDTKNFVTGMKTLMASGLQLTKNGLAISMYAFSQDMVDQHLYNSDGDFLIVPQCGSLLGVPEKSLKLSAPAFISRGCANSVKARACP
jgi:homogentisate 1,2-dioxygenase